jgi:DNA-binding SARP family transcriptional activator
LQTAVVSYIALHSPIAASRVEDAVWTAPTANRRKRLANTVSEARASLGAQHLPVASDGRYSVGPRVATDMQSLENRMSYAAAQLPEAAIETLRGGLELVRGRPFTYPDGDRPCYVWVDLENWSVRAELLVISAAERMGELCLAAGDYEQAAWAASCGLGASPAHTRLTELLMRAHAGAGDRHAANRVYENHVNALQLLEIDVVAESTLALHDELCSVQPA